MLRTHTLVVRDKVAILPLLAILPACGSNLENKALPKPANELSQADVTDDNIRSANQRWNELSSKLKLLNDGSASSLKSPSDWFSDTADARSAYNSLTETIAAEHLKTARSTGCAEVVSFETLGKAKSIAIGSAVRFPSEVETAKWYLMKYKRFKADGTPDAMVNGALVSVPTATTNTYPVIAYAHAGDAGLSALEIAAVFGELQAKHIVVAPAFPGESICKFGTNSANKSACDASGRYFDAVGVSAPFSTDAEDLLAAHNCLVTPNALPDFNSTVLDRIKFQNIPDAATAMPVSYMFGSSRGGLTTSIALAKNTAMLQYNAKTGTTRYSEPKYFYCAGTNINPTSFTYGEIRVYLEAVVKGTAESSATYRLPTAPQLNDLFKDYREGRLSSAEAALLIQTRDATFNAPLALASVRKWSTGDKGAFFTMHGTLDKSIPISQGIFGGSVFASINAILTANRQSDPTAAPGVHLSTMGTIAQPPYSVDGGKTLAPGSTMHGDFAWFDSLVGVNTSVTDSAGQPVALDASYPFLGKKPLDAFAAWLENSSVGCGASIP
ncbi:MAG: hypothetical protein ACO3A4_09095 [Silvanigrellaceae bacterium]